MEDKKTKTAGQQGPLTVRSIMRGLWLYTLWLCMLAVVGAGALALGYGLLYACFFVVYVRAGALGWIAVASVGVVGILGIFLAYRAIDEIFRKIERSLNTGDSY